MTRTLRRDSASPLRGWRSLIAAPLFFSCASLAAISAEPTPPPAVADSLPASSSSAPASFLSSSPASASASQPTSTPASQPASAPASQPKRVVFTQEGRASYYSDRLHGRGTASGEPYDKRAMTCSHLKLPFGTLVEVTHLKSGRSVVVRVNDRGPFGGRRIIDLSRAAAEELGMIAQGEARVRLTVYEP